MKFSTAEKLVALAILAIVIFGSGIRVGEASDAKVEAHLRLLMDEAGLAEHSVEVVWGLPAGYEERLHRAVAECKPVMKVYLARSSYERGIHTEVLPHEVAHLAMCSKYGHMGGFTDDKIHGPEWEALWLESYERAARRAYRNHYLTVH